jgi:hypothetical protein
MTELLGTIVLWALAVILIVGAGFSWLTREGMRSAGARTGSIIPTVVAAVIGLGLVIMLLMGGD